MAACTTDGTTECCICLESFSDSVCKVPLCHHEFHVRCLSDWVAACVAKEDPCENESRDARSIVATIPCPFCRNSLNMSSIGGEIEQLALKMHEKKLMEDKETRMRTEHARLSAVRDELSSQLDDYFRHDVLRRGGDEEEAHMEAWDVLWVSFQSARQAAEDVSQHIHSYS